MTYFCSKFKDKVILKNLKFKFFFKIKKLKGNVYAPCSFESGFYMGLPKTMAFFMESL